MSCQDAHPTKYTFTFNLPNGDQLALGFIASHDQNWWQLYYWKCC